MTELKNQLNNDIVENDGLALKIFKESCCDNCSCKSEADAIKIIDNMGREKFWEDTDIT
jgi:hypothetical protein